MQMPPEESPRQSMALIELVNVKVAFGSRTVFADLNLTVEDGEFVTVLGPSGCGKTTLLNLLGGFERPTSGSLRIGPPLPQAAPPRVGMVFQEYAVFPWHTALGNVVLGLKHTRGSAKQREERASVLLEQVGLAGHERAFPKALSGGMKQRVAIARTLAIDPAIILMDEPFGALDSYMREQLQDLILTLWRDLGKTIIFVTHNVREAVFLGNRVIVFNEPGRIIYDSGTPVTRDRTDERVIAQEKEIRALVLGRAEH